jgi:hypothetical protein
MNNIIKMSSEQMMILNGVDFNPSEDVKYSTIKVNSVGGKSVGILNAATNKAVYLNTPLMLTWGLNEYTDEKTGKVTYDMSLQFPSSDYPNEDAEAFLESMKTFEEKIKEDALKNSKEWFGKKHTAEVLDALFTPMLKYPKDKETGEPDLDRPPTLRVKIPYWEGEWKTEIYDLDGEPLFPDKNSSHISPKDLITKGSNVAVLILCGGIWFANGKFGVTWKLQQAALKPKISMKGKFLLSISEEDKARAERLKSSEESDEDDVVDTQVSDDEEEIEEEVAKVVEPVKKTVKKKVVKKKE